MFGWLFGWFWDWFFLFVELFLVRGLLPFGLWWTRQPKMELSRILCSWEECLTLSFVSIWSRKGNKLAARRRRRLVITLEKLKQLSTRKTSKSWSHVPEISTTTIQQDIYFLPGKQPISRPSSPRSSEALEISCCPANPPGFKATSDAETQRSTT